MKILLAWLSLTAAVAAADSNPSTNRPALTIDAGFSRFDLKSNFFLYSNGVTVFDPPARSGEAPTIMTCKWLTAQRGTNGRLELIVAHESVDMVQGDKNGRGGLAVYTATNELMTLTEAFDPADTNMPMPVLFSPQGTQTGPEIVYDRLHDQLIMPKGVKTIIPQSTLDAQRGKTNSLGPNDKPLAPKPKPLFP